MPDSPTTAEIQIGHQAMWVHAGDTGECLGRFGVYGIDVHRRISDQHLGQCLDCTHERTTLIDWHRFPRSMLAYHGVDISATMVCKGANAVNNTNCAVRRHGQAEDEIRKLKALVLRLTESLEDCVRDLRDPGAEALAAIHCGRNLIYG